METLTKIIEITCGLKFISQYFQQVHSCYVFFILEQKDKVYLH